MAQQLRLQGRFGFRNVRLVKSEENSLGNGSYGAVYRAKCDQLVCAAKVLHPILFQTRDPAAYRIVERFQREIDFLSGLRHPNVIQYLGSCADPETRMPVLFMELMDESLTSFLERPADPPPLPLHVQVDIGHDVAQALSYLHRHEVLHRDLSSNNVLLIGSRRAKVTDFGMAKLLGSDPRLTPTYCPGTNAYMSPEALADPPTYTSKLDVFSCGVLFVQLITRKWPNPGPRMHTVQVGNDPRFPSGRALVEVPELERRKEHLDLISPTHPLLEVALDCLKDKEGQRPTAEQLCSRLIALKESAAYRDSLQQTPEETTGQAPPARDQELEQQLRERVEDLTREVQQLTLQNEEQARSIQQKDELVHRKDEENHQLQHQNHTLQVSRRENEEVVAALQQSVEQKDAALRAKDELLQEKEREIRELQQRVREREGSGVATGPLKLEWRDGPPAPFPTYGRSVAVDGEMVYCRNRVSSTIVLMFNSRTGQWTELLECPKRFFSIAVVNGQLRAIGGEQSYKATNTLLSLPQDRPGVFQQKWIEQFPPMTYCRNAPTVATTNTSLIVAGGAGPNQEKAPVEVMDIQTLQWSTVASLPHPLWQASATICGNRLYIGGGYSTGGYATKSVVMCEVKDLLQSQPQSLATRLGLSSSPPVWKEVAPLPVVQSSLVTFQGQLLAVGGGNPHSTSEVRQYDATTNSWSVISHMKMKRRYCLAAVLPNNTLMVCGDIRPPTTSVEIASVTF
jgi:serine/threonine protein kinase